MRKALIGEEVALEVACEEGAWVLVAGLVEDLLRVGSGRPRDDGRARRVEERVRAAIDALRQEGGDGDRLEARLTVVPRGVEVHLLCRSRPPLERRLTIPEA